jgi:hypothetical protein
MMYIFALGLMRLQRFECICGVIQAVTDFEIGLLAEAAGRLQVLADDLLAGPFYDADRVPAIRWRWCWARLGRCDEAVVYERI